MPLANLCSRLLLSRAPAGSPTPKLAACAVPPAATLPDASAGACARATIPDRPRRRRIAVAGFPTLGGNAVNAASTSCSRVHRSPKGARFPEHQPASAFSAEHEPDEATTDAPCHNLGCRPVTRPAPREPGPASLTPRQKCVFPGSRASSAGRSRRAPPLACAWSAALRAATGTLASPPRPSFRHAFTHNLVR
jgi:hypothetical protein